MARKILLSGSAQGAVAESDDDKNAMETAPADPAETDQEDAPPAKGKAKSKSKAEDAPPEDETDPEETKAAAVVSQDRAIVKACTEAGAADMAYGFMEAGLTLAQVQHRLQDAPEIRSAVADASRKHPMVAFPSADECIAGGKSAVEVKAELYDCIRASQGPEMQTHRADKAPERMDGAPTSSAKLWAATFERLGIETVGKDNRS